MKVGRGMKEKWNSINVHTRALILVVTDALLFSLMGLLVRLSGDVPLMQKSFFRNFGAAIVAVLFLSGTPERFRIRKESWKYLIPRSLLGTCSVVLNFWALAQIPIADANILNKMSPFFAIIFSLFLLGEKPKAFEWGCVFMAFAGASFIVKPGIGMAGPGAFAGLMSGATAGAAYTYLRRLGKIGERAPAIVMVFSLISSAICLPSMLFHYYPMDLRQWCLLLGAGACAGLAQFCITGAYILAPAKEISVFDYSQVVFATLWGILFFSEYPDIYSFIGYIIVIGTAVVKWKYNLRETEGTAGRKG